MENEKEKEKEKYPIYHYDIIQRSDEWFSIRKGKFTASNAQSIGNQGKGLETYIWQVLTKKYSDGFDYDYKNDDIQRGVELEEQAKMVYEIEKEPVTTVGFIEMDEYVGCSPDGLIGDEGGIEIKCPNDTNYMKLLLQGERAIESKYIWQCQMFLLVAERSWIDFVAYNPNFDKNLIVVRMKKDLAMQEKLIVGIEKGKQLIKILEQKYAERSL